LQSPSPTLPPAHLLSSPALAKALACELTN
jgi:hypothetical protein